MKLKLSLLAIPITLCLQLTQAQNTPVLKYLPENASMIVRLSPAHMKGKLTTEDFRQSMIFKMLTKDKTKLDSLSLFGNPNHTGIDFAGDLFFVQAIDSKGEKPHKSMMIFGKIKDETAFRNLLQKFLQKDSVRVYGTNKLILSKGLSLAWNEEVFVVLADKGANNYGADTLSGKQRIKALDKAMKEEREQCFAMLTPHTGGFYTTDTYFMSMINTGADVSIWNNNGKSSLPMGADNPLLKFLKLPSMSKEKKYTTLNFDNGQLTINARNFPPDSLAAVYEQYPAAPQNPELLRRLPANTVLFINASYRHEWAKAISKNMTLPQSVTDSIRKFLPFDPSQFSGTFRDNVLFAILPGEKTTGDSTTKLKIGFLIAIPIADKQKFDQLKSKLLPAWDSIMQKGSSQKFLKGFSISAKSNDRFLVVSHSADIAAKFLSDPNQMADSTWDSKYAQFPVYGQLHIRSMMEMVTNALDKEKTSKKMKQAQPFLALFDNIVISAGRFENHSLNAQVEIKMPDKNTNALKQLFEMINQLLNNGMKEGQ